MSRNSLKRPDEAEADALAYLDSLFAGEESGKFTKYQTDPLGYMREQLGMEPWPGCNGKPGQLELVEDIAESVRAQLAGEPHIKVFHVEAGHGVGKTYVAAGLVNWFFDSFSPSVTITTAPSKDQVELLLWKDIKSMRRGKNLPGRVLPEAPKMVVAEDHWAIGRTTNDNQGQGTTRAQGQHNKYWLFILDEAEGVPAFFFSAIDAMMTGGEVGIVIMLANPQTRTSEFHKRGKQSKVRKYRLSVLDHPNVVSGEEIVHGATKRSWAQDMIALHCEPVDEHDDDENTFQVGFEVDREGVVYPDGTIWKPNAEFCFRVLGIAPANLADKTFVTPGRYEAAKARGTQADESADASHAQIGIDCARFGKDYGTVYALHRKRLRRTKQVYKANSFDYLAAAKGAALDCAKHGATSVSFRVDGTGGFGGGVVDLLNADEELKRAFPGGLVVHEIHFGSNASASDKYDDIVTEMYAQAGETIKGIGLVSPPNELESDLTEREYGWVNRDGQALKKLVDKEKFRSKRKRSPDDGDGCVLALAPEFIFKAPPTVHGITPINRLATVPRRA